MRRSAVWTTFGRVLIPLLAQVQSIRASTSPVVIKGTHFSYPNATAFVLRGLVYQPADDVSSNGTANGPARSPDPLADPAACARDVSLMRELGTNVVRVRAVEAAREHAECMRRLADAGIYVLVDLPARIEGARPAWTTDVQQAYAAVVDAFAPFDNTLGFLAGTDVANATDSTAAAAFVKAAVRDIKAHIRAKGYRDVGVGYATGDHADIRADLVDYLTCGGADAAVDFLGYNLYSWCGDSSFQDSGYEEITRALANLTVPVFLAEYGCNTVRPRTFSEVPTIYGPQMSGVWSGGIVQQYFQSSDDSGLVEIINGEPNRLLDFAALAGQLATVPLTSTDLLGSASASTSPPTCPQVDAKWRASSTLPLSPDADLCGCMLASLNCMAKPSLSLDDATQLMDKVCKMSPTACGMVTANASSGVYGALSMCTASERLSIVLDGHYHEQKQQKSACDFYGSAAVVQANATSTRCETLLDQAGLQAATSAQDGSAGPGDGASSLPAGDPAAAQAAAIAQIAAAGFIGESRCGVLWMLVTTGMLVRAVCMML